MLLIQWHFPGLPLQRADFTALDVQHYKIIFLPRKVLNNKTLKKNDLFAGYTEILQFLAVYNDDNVHSRFNKASVCLITTVPITHN